MTVIPFAPSVARPEGGLGPSPRPADVSPLTVTLAARVPHLDWRWTFARLPF